jgi:regulator of replication initiation timing
MNKSMTEDKLQEIEDYFAKQIVHPKIGNYVYELIKGVKDLHWHNEVTLRCNTQLGESKRNLIEQNQTLQQENNRYKQALEEIANSEILEPQRLTEREQYIVELFSKLSEIAYKALK